MLRTARFVLPAVSVFLLAMCVGTVRAAELTPTTGGLLPAWAVCPTVEAFTGKAGECSDDAINAAFAALKAACDRPHRSNFELTCDSEGGVASLEIDCDIW